MTRHGEEATMFTPDTLAGTAAIVTGGATGIGGGIARALAAAGAAVAVAPHANLERAERLAADLRAGGARVLVQPCDVRDEGQVQALVDATVAAFGRLDVLVNNAGITEPRPLLELTAAEWDKTHGVNLRGAFLCTQAAARAMIAAGNGGAVVNLSSVHGFGGAPDHAHYEASKGGLNLFTKASAVELGPHGIRVNAIAPGVIEVERYADFANYDPAEWGGRLPAGRVGYPDDVGPLAVFLASAGAAYITGQVIYVDGGLTAQLGGGRR
jgi:NAD(P)-dependent dehydrogenase (short-subunit alcohol dehydrogenase family)